MTFCVLLLEEPPAAKITEDPIIGLAIAIFSYNILGNTFTISIVIIKPSND